MVITTFHGFHRSSFHTNYSPVYTSWDKLARTSKENKGSKSRRKSRKVVKLPLGRVAREKAEGFMQVREPAPAP